MKVKDVCDVLRYCCPKVMVEDNRTDSGYLVVASSLTRPYRFSSMIWDAEVKYIFPEKGKFVAIVID